MGKKQPAWTQIPIKSKIREISLSGKANAKELKFISDAINYRKLTPKQKKWINDLYVRYVRI